MADDAVCFFGWNGRRECSAETNDLVGDGWYMGLDSSHEHADAVFVCPNCVDVPPLVCCELLCVSPGTGG